MKSSGKGRDVSLLREWQLYKEGEALTVKDCKIEIAVRTAESKRIIRRIEIERERLAIAEHQLKISNEQIAILKKRRKDRKR